MPTPSIDKPPARVKRRWQWWRKSDLFWIFVILLFGVWTSRLLLINHIANAALARFEIHGVSWQLEDATWGRLRLGETTVSNANTNLLSLGSAEINWSFRGLLSHRIDRVEINNLRIPATFDDGNFDLPLLAWAQETVARFPQKTDAKKSSTPWRITSLTLDASLDLRGARTFLSVSHACTHGQECPCSPIHILLNMRDDDGTYRLSATAHSSQHLALLDASLDPSNRVAGEFTLPRIAHPEFGEAHDTTLRFNADLSEFRGAANFSTRLSSPKIPSPPMTLSGRLEAALITNIVHLAASARVEEFDTGFAISGAYDIAQTNLQLQGTAHSKLLEAYGSFAPRILLETDFKKTTASVEQSAGRWHYQNAAGLDVSAEGRVIIKAHVDQQHASVKLVFGDDDRYRDGDKKSYFRADFRLPDGTHVRLPNIFAAVGFDNDPNRYGSMSGWICSRGAMCELPNGLRIANDFFSVGVFGDLVERTFTASVVDFKLHGNSCFLPPQLHDALTARLSFPSHLVTPKVLPDKPLRLPDIALIPSSMERLPEEPFSIAGYSLFLPSKLLSVTHDEQLGDLQTMMRLRTLLILDASGLTHKKSGMEWLNKPYKNKDMSTVFASANGLTLFVNESQFAISSKTLRATIPLSLTATQIQPNEFHQINIGEIPSPSLRADLSLDLPLDAPERFTAHIKIPETTLDDNDPLVAFLKSKIPSTPSIPTFRATLGGEARVEMSRGKPLVSATGFVKNAAFSAMDWTLENFSTSDINVEFRNGRLRTTDSPTLRFDTLTHTSGFTLGPGEAQGRWSGNEGFLEKASVRWGEGALRMYAVRFNPAAPQINTRLYIDRVDVGSALTLFPTFAAEGSGVLYGELPINYANKRIRLSQGFLYSLPGERGELRFRDPTKISGLLGMVGITENERIAESLRRIEFSLLRLDLNATNPDDTKLRFRVEGTSLSEQYPGTPVNLNINLNAPLETMLNFSVRMNELLKGK